MTNSPSVCLGKRERESGSINECKSERVSVSVSVAVIERERVTVSEREKREYV